MIKILIVEDEEAIANLIYKNLHRCGYECRIALDGKRAADLLQEHSFQLCLLDIMLPGIDGYELFSYADALKIPVIFLTAKGETMDKVKGLRMGAQDYITKPFEILELIARVENVLRRTNRLEQTMDICGLHIDMVSRSVMRDGRHIDLTYKEYDLLMLFVSNTNVALYRELIYERVWGSSFMGDSRTVDLHVQRLRKKAGLEKEIEAVYKVGYRFRGEG